ncbi:MAG: hypothetical protein CBB96_03840 [Gammaproteobacteria bacterium TMED36]|nr:MAG: hypothetical protein CBB96_03840 [Gammaproteobacteria bacterium TMED36]|tara:strand:- start:56 stop:631 length:576 start_codon:yes stop_codon:yes gene_type:complete
MSLFEYIAILVSLVLGLAISNTLIKISLLLQFSRHLSQSWHVLMWSLLVLFSSVAYFFLFWTMYSSTTDISIAEFTLAPFFTVILFFLLSRFLPINDLENSEILLEDYFLKYKNAFFLCFTLLWLQMFTVVHLIILPRLGLEFSLLQKSQYLLPLILAAGIKLNNTEQHKKLVVLYAIIYVFQEFIATSIE